MNFEQLAKIDGRINAGGWVGDLPDLPGVSFKVRSTSNWDYQRLNAQLRPPRKEDEPELTEAENTAIQTVLLRETILLDWSGIDEPFSEEAATRYLALHVVRAGVWYAAAVVASQGTEEAALTEKNSSKPSAGRSRGANTAPATQS